MMKFALHIISSAGFGMKLAWNDACESLPQGHKLTFKQALEHVDTKLMYYLITPSYFYWLPIPSLQKLKHGFDGN